MQAPSVLKACIVFVLTIATSFVPARGSDIVLVNRCPFKTTAFWRSGAGATNRYVLPAHGGTHTLDVGNSWVAAVLWGSYSGNINNGQASQIEFSINPPNQPGRDFYDISLVNAYNIPTMINPTKLAPGAHRSGKYECGTPKCLIPNINSFCRPPNTIQGADKACINHDGPGLYSTQNTAPFKHACPDAYSYSKDDATSTYGCKTGTNYELVFCYDLKTAVSNLPENKIAAANFTVGKADISLS